ncbi:MAG TPA: protein kinase [Vicinamibacteria bacterium]
MGAFEVLAPLGAGGMGEVYRARDLRLGREVALKVLPAERLADESRRLRFVQEAKAASALSHPHIVTVHEVGSSDGTDFIVMEYVPGTTLDAVIPPHGMRLGEALRVATAIADALAAAHAKGIVHRDLKPANVIVGPEGVVKVLDFGLAKLLGDEPDASSDTLSTAVPLTEAGAVLGTAPYMSPEQATGGRADTRSDIFSFGAVLYEMVTGRRAFAGRTLPEVRAAVVRDQPKPARELVPEIPDALERVIQRCLRKEPERRFQHMGDVKVELVELREEADSGRTTTGAARPSARAPRVARWRWTLGLAALAGLVAGAGWLLRAPQREHAPSLLASVPFTTLPGREVAPSFSPDGSQIAFGWSNAEGQGAFDLYVKVIGSEKLLRLTNHPADWIAPAWSPDGRTIAFSRQSEDAGGIYLVPALGGPERRLSDTTIDFYLRAFLSWSADSKLLAYAEPVSEGGRIRMLDVGTLESRAVPLPSKECQWAMIPALSPDGRSVATVCLVQYGVFAILSSTVSGEQPRKLAVGEGSVTGLTYSADGKHLIWSEGEGGSLWRVGVAGGAPERILSSQDAHMPAVSRTGRRLAYTQQIQTTNLWRIGIAGPTGSEAAPRALISSSRSQYTAAYSPDGRRVAFVSNRTGTLEIWVCDADGSDPVAITSVGGPLTGSPSWSPDGREIGFDSRIAGEAHAFVVRADGGPQRRLDTGIANSSQPRWSRDGRWLYFIAGNDQSTQVYRMPASGGPAAPLTRHGGYWPQESPDGRRVFYGSGATLWSVPADGGDEQEVAGFPRLEATLRANWALVTGGIYFVEPAGAGAALSYFDLRSRSVRRVVELPARPEPYRDSLAVSPDGRSILVSQRERLSGDIMIVENFE